MLPPESCHSHNHDPCDAEQCLKTFVVVVPKRMGGGLDGQQHDMDLRLAHGCAMLEGP